MRLKETAALAASNANPERNSREGSPVYATIPDPRDLRENARAAEAGVLVQHTQSGNIDAVENVIEVPMEGNVAYALPTRGNIAYERVSTSPRTSTSHMTATTSPTVTHTTAAGSIPTGANVAYKSSGTRKNTHQIMSAPGAGYRISVPHPN